MRRGFAAHAPCRLNPSAMREVDERGHEDVPADIFVPCESERHAGREVEQAEPCIKQRRSPIGGRLQTFSG